MGKDGKQLIALLTDNLWWCLNTKQLICFQSKPGRPESWAAVFDNEHDEIVLVLCNEF